MVAERLHHRKIGSRMLAAIKAHSRISAIEQVELNTSSLLGQKFYSPAGWELQPREPEKPMGQVSMTWFPRGRPA